MCRFVLVRFFFISILYNRQWCTFEYGCQRKGLQHIHHWIHAVRHWTLYFKFLDLLWTLIKEFWNWIIALFLILTDFSSLKPFLFILFKFLKCVLYSFRKNWIELKVPFWFNLDFDMRLRLLVTIMLLDSDLDSKDMKY